MKYRHRKVPEKRRKDHEEDLRAENRKLRKEIQQLRKHLTKWRFREEDIDDIIEDIEVNAEQSGANIKGCPKCGSSKIKVIEKLRGNIDYYVCDGCGSQGQLK